MEAFRDWLDTSRKGKIYIYHTGFLAVDRGSIVDFTNGAFSINPDSDIDCVARMALDAFNSHRVHLFQRKLHDREYQYIAMKRGKYDNN